MEVDLGFIVLCPDRNIGGLKNTCGSIRHHSYNREAICVVGNDATTAEVKEMKDICPTYKGKDTITSLINTGFRYLKHEWGLLLFGGSRIPIFLERRITSFTKNEEDILFSVVEKRYDFVTGSFNGVLINKKFFKKVGNFPDEKMEKAEWNDFEMAKLLWALDAHKQGAIFKGIVGMRII